MDADAKKPRPERDMTDESLRAERHNSDRALVKRRTDQEEDADDVVERARDKADAVLDIARDRADDELHRGDDGGLGREAIARARSREDEVLEDERATEDERLRRDRVEHARTLAALLPLEREKTDRHLLTERTRSDDALGNRDHFVDIVSHDLRNLLSGVALNATLLSKQASATEEGQRTVSAMTRIRRYVAHMSRLIGDLVDVVSIDAGTLAVQPERCDVAALLAEAVDAFAPAASAQEISLRAEAAERELAADIDHVRLLQVLANVIGNALKFTPRGGEIVVRARRVGDELHLSVTDTGMGIPADMLEAVFERFCQVGQDDRRGRGLGLYISRRIVDAHGGRIWVESELGAWSTFHVVIPGAV